MLKEGTRRDRFDIFYSAQGLSFIILKTTARHKRNRLYISCFRKACCITSTDTYLRGSSMFKKFSSSTQAVLIAILAYGSFSNADAINKLLTQSYSIPTTLAVGSLLGLTVSSVWIFLAKGVKGFMPPTWKMHMIRACIVAASS